MRKNPCPIRDCPLWFGVLLGWLPVISPALAGENSAQLVARARDGNRAAIQSIVTMECRYERQPWGNSSLDKVREHFALFSPGRFWRSGDTYRLFKPMRDGTTLDCLIRNGQGHSLRKGKQMPRPTLTFATLNPIDGVGTNMWQWLLFSHWGWVPPSFYPFQDILDHPHTIRTAEQRSPTNDIHIELTHGGGRLEFWFDPKVNYLIRKSIMVPEGDKTFRWEHEVIEFAEPAPAVFVPITIEHRCCVKGTLEAIIRTTLSELKVNQPLAKNALRLPGIQGMECLDMDRNVKYKVDADANRAGPESPLQAFKMSPPSNQTRSNFSLGDSNASLEPSRPPMPLWQWILIISSLLLVVALIVAIVRRRQALQS